MTINCKLSHAKCNAMCCNIVPIEKDIYERNRSHLVRKVLEEMPFLGQTMDERDISLIIPQTEDGRCPFLNEDLSCNIYDDRPKVCRKYGDESHSCLRCPYQDKNGNMRSRQQTRFILRQADKEAQKLIKIGNRL